MATMKGTTPAESSEQRLPGFDLSSVERTRPSHQLKKAPTFKGEDIWFECRVFFSAFFFLCGAAVDGGNPGDQRADSTLVLPAGGPVPAGVDLQRTVDIQQRPRPLVPGPERCVGPKSSTKQLKDALATSFHCTESIETCTQHGMENCSVIAFILRSLLVDFKKKHLKIGKTMFIRISEKKSGMLSRFYKDSHLLLPQY